MQVQTPILRAVYTKPVLWTLECVYSQCANLTVLPKEQRSLVHRQDLSTPSTSAMRVGRLFHGDFFRLLLPDDSYLGQVSREHFQIWAEEWPGSAHSHSSSCSFFLTNFGTVGTMVDNVALTLRGQQLPLHHGSSICLFGACLQEDSSVSHVPFLEFRFSLEGSTLTDAEALPRSPQRVAIGSSTSTRPGQNGLTPPVSPEKENLSKTGAPCQQPVFECLPIAREGFGDVVDGATSFCGVDIEPIFVLEVRGTSLRSKLPVEHHRIVHGPSTAACAAAPGCEVPCPPLALGLDLQPGFWQRLLRPDALDCLAKQHLLIEAEECLHYSDERRFFVRNLGNVQLRVEGSEDSSPSFDRAEDGRWYLHHGDTIVVSSTKGKTLWLAFRELMATKTPLAAVPMRGPNSKTANGFIN